jgi:ribosomal protein S18 acetylase RimI-like enzyme
MSSSPTPGTRWQDHIGHRIVVRIRAAGGVRDVLGDLLAADADRLRVRTRRGEVDVDPASIIAGHPVPPAPTRAAPPHRALSVGGLELLMAQHWQADEQDWLGGWLLRATGGFTNRANSVLAVGEPGMPLDVAVTEVSDWYAERGLRPVAAMPEPGLDEPDAEQLLTAAGAFQAAGWSPIEGAGALVMTAPTGEARGAAVGLPAGLSSQLQDAPDPAWISQYHYRGQPVPEHGVRLLTSAPEQVFASIRDGERVVGVVRGSLAERWAGLTAMEVDPQYRRRGLALALVALIAQWGWQRGVRSIFLQVSDANTAAQALYRGAGFTTHHRYDYLSPSA